MSHAIVVVALDKTDDLEGAVMQQMAPFDEAERGGWFADGSRWDWFALGGRWPEYFGPHGYALRLGDFDEAAYVAHRREALAKSYARAMSADPPYHPESLEYITGIKFGETLEDFQARLIRPFPVARAFLRNRHWHEGGRLGWWCSTAKTECELVAEADIQAMRETGVLIEPQFLAKCLTKLDDGSRIITWNQDEQAWGDNFVRRFIRPLSPDTILVAVDYHV